jgi:hypothetical protein
MWAVLERIYGKELTKEILYNEEDLANIIHVCGGKQIVVYNEGIKIHFKDILARYDGSIPSIYDIGEVNRSPLHEDHIGNQGFLLLKADENMDGIRAYYDTIRRMFCDVNDLFNMEVNEYIRTMKAELPVPDGKTWADFGSLGWPANFNVDDAIRYIVYLITLHEGDSILTKLLKYYVRLFSINIGDVLNCHITPPTAPYMVVKLLDPAKPFEYDNTEMVVKSCYFSKDTPAQYHHHILRNPSIMIQRKLQKQLPEKYDIIMELRRTVVPRIF